MTVHLQAFCFDAATPSALAEFWAGVLERDVSDDGSTLLPTTDTDFDVRFVPSGNPKLGPNLMHFDLTSQSAEEQQRTVTRALELGGRHLDIGQGPDANHVVLADPEGNEFCVIEAGNNFLANTAFIGALSGDGTQQCGYFWAEALGWPLVWDQDEETAIQSPRGGAKLTWGGPPLAPKFGKNRVHLNLVPDGDQDAEVARLLDLGATRLDISQGDVPWVVLADVDGNAFCVLTPR